MSLLLWLYTLVDIMASILKKWNNFSPGISLTAQTWFVIMLLFRKLVLPAKNAEDCEEK